MPIRTWLGQSDSVAQVSEVQITTFDAATVYDLLIGGEVIATAQGGDVTAVRDALVAAWNASTHPYKTNITASPGATDVVIFSSSDPGMPFIVTTSTTGGTGAFGPVTDTTPVKSPNDWTNPDNWAEKAVPVTGDDVVCRDGAVDIRWGLDQAGVQLATLTVEKSFTGKIGLNRTSFLTDAAGALDSSKSEYRPQYLGIGYSRCDIGEVLGPGAPPGSTRIKLRNVLAGTSTTVVHDGSSSSEDGDLPAIRLLTDAANARVEVRSAPGGFGMGVDGPDEVAFLERLDVTDQTPATRITIGEGVSVNNWRQLGGIHTIKSAVDITSCQVLGGELTVEGTTVLTLLQITDGVCRSHNKPGAGSSIIDAQIDGGTLDGDASQEPRTWDSVSLNFPGATVRADTQVVTITDLKPPLGPMGVTAV